MKFFTFAALVLAALVGTAAASDVMLRGTDVSTCMCVSGWIDAASWGCVPGSTMCRERFDRDERDSIEIWGGGKGGEVARRGVGFGAKRQRSATIPSNGGALDSPTRLN